MLNPASNRVSHPSAGSIAAQCRQRFRNAYSAPSRDFRRALGDMAASLWVGPQHFSSPAANRAGVR